jgi:hypothetical protein
VVRFCPNYPGGEPRDIGQLDQESLEKLIYVFFFVFYECPKFLRLDSSLREETPSKDHPVFLGVRE